MAAAAVMAGQEVEGPEASLEIVAKPGVGDSVQAAREVAAEAAAGVALPKALKVELQEDLAQAVTQRPRGS